MSEIVQHFLLSHRSALIRVVLMSTDCDLSRACLSITCGSIRGVLSADGDVLSPYYTQNDQNPMEFWLLCVR